MKLTIFAATGGTGRHILDQAVDAGHDVTAVVRSPEKLSRRVRAVAADLAAPDPAVLESEVAGADAVLSGLGPRSRAEAGIASKGTRAIVDAMKATDVRRLVVVSVAGIMTIPSPGRPNPPRRDPGSGFFVHHVLGRLARYVLREHYADVALMEDILRDSGLDWTSVQVPLLTDRPPRGSHRTAYGQSVRGGFRIARADAAQFMLRVIGQPETFGQAITVAY